MRPEVKFLHLLVDKVQKNENIDYNNNTPTTYKFDDELIKIIIFQKKIKSNKKNRFESERQSRTVQINIIEIEM